MRSGNIRGYSTMVSVPVFQTGNVGSIPTTRSNRVRVGGLFLYMPKYILCILYIKT